MSPRTVRLILSISLIIAALCLYLLVFAALDRRFNDEGALAIAGVNSVIVFSIGWILIWRPEIPRTRHRLLLAVATSLVSLAIAFNAGWFAAVVARREEFGFVLGALAYVPLFCGGTALAWRETAVERARRLRQTRTAFLECPKCRYNLTGLHEARCPECGTAYTLDELLSVALGQLWGGRPGVDQGA